MTGKTFEPIELTFYAEKNRRDPFNEIELDVLFRNEEGREWIVPAFWAGGNVWKVRFRAEHAGRYTYRTGCRLAAAQADTTAEKTNPIPAGELLEGVLQPDPGLDKAGTLDVVPYDGENPLYRHGAPRVSENGRYFRYADGTPFVWFGDSWHPFMTDRINAAETEVLVSDRAAKGVTVVEFQNGFISDVKLWDKRLSNEGGFAWDTALSGINPAYYNAFDEKFRCLTDHGISACIITAWGFYMRDFGVEKMNRHIRHMIARWGAYPVFWIMAGETSGLPYSDLTANPGDASARAHADDWYTSEKAKEMWGESLAYLKRTDPWQSPVSTHVFPGLIAPEDIGRPELLDFTAYQAGFHAEDYKAVSKDIRGLTGRGYAMHPAKPVVNLECCYEGMLDQNGPKVQRWVFWHSILEGCAGTTYGACGIYNMSHLEKPFGIPAYRLNWGDWSWQEAMDFEGLKQISRNRKFLNKYEWWRLLPAPDKIVSGLPEDCSGKELWQERVAAEIPGELLMAYYQPFVTIRTIVCEEVTGVTFRNLHPGDTYEILLYDPVRDREIPSGTAVVDTEGLLRTPAPPASHDWVFIARKA